ncbi:MAG: glycosyltransferase [Microbacterium sp.]
MTTSPTASIIVPVLGDAEQVVDALRARATAPVTDVESIFVVGSGAHVEKVDSATSGNGLVKVVHVPGLRSLGEAHRAGVRASTSPFVLLLEPGDEPRAHELVAIVGEAHSAQADLVLAGPTLPHRLLEGDDVLPALFPEDTVVDRHRWRFVARADLLRQVYREMDDSLAPDPAAVFFLACAAAHRVLVDPASFDSFVVAHASATASAATALDRALSALSAFGSIAPVVRAWARTSPNPEPLVEGHETVRLALLTAVIRQLEHCDEQTRAAGIGALRSIVGERDAVIAAAVFAPDILAAIAQRGDRIELGTLPVRSVLLTTNVITTGGVSGVLLTQAKMLLDAGYRVIVAAHRPGSDQSVVPEGAEFVQISAIGKRDRLVQWAEVCERHAVDVVIDHRILYSRDWPAYALVARAQRAATIGWIHNFAGRPTYNGNDLHSLMRDHLGALAHLIVLSPLDVAFWKLRGIRHVSYLPNPPSPLLLESAAKTTPKTPPGDRRVELVWWGRLEEHTKKVTQLVEVAAALKALGIDFRMRIVGPDWAGMTASRLSALAAERGVASFVEATGPRRGAELLETIDSSDIFVNTSIIEGYPLTLPEAQSRGLPIVMYDLPWLSLIKDNPGIATVPQGDAGALAATIAALVRDRETYATMSRASISAAQRATAHDFAQLYEQLLHGTLPAEFSPEPALEEGRLLLNLLTFFADQSLVSTRPGPSPAVDPARRGGSRHRPQSVGARIERKLTPLGHRVLFFSPWLRPVARRVKFALQRR